MAEDKDLSATTAPATAPSQPAAAARAPQDGTAHCASDTAANPDLKAPAHKTKGEKLFDLGLYTGLNYFVNLAVSVVIADMFLHRTGKLNNTFLKCRKAFNSGLSAVMPEKMAKEWSDIAAKTATLPLGGHLVMAPVKLLEDRKKRITYWINRKFFPEEYAGKNIELKPVSQMRDDELPEVVECPPKASWGSIVNRRLLAWGSAIATNSILDRSIRIQGKSFNHFVVDKAAAISGLKHDSRLERYARLTATDSYLTVVTAFVTRITNGTFFKKKKSPDILAEAAISPSDNDVLLRSDHGNKTARRILETGPKLSFAERAIDAQPLGAPGL